MAKVSNADGFSDAQKPGEIVASGAMGRIEASSASTDETAAMVVVGKARSIER